MTFEVLPSSILPFKNWFVVVGDSYELVVDIFDADNSKIFPSDNVVMEFEIDKEYFRVERRVENNTWHLGIPLKAGVAEVRAALLGVADSSGSLVPLPSPLRAAAEMDIFEKISLEPKVSVFPWDPTTRPTYSVKYSVTPEDERQTASFLWSSGNQSVATVTQNGVARTTTELGEVNIKAAMSRATHNFGIAKIRVMLASGKLCRTWIETSTFPSSKKFVSTGLKFLPDRLETEVDTKLDLPVTMSGIDGSAFTQCHKVSLVTALSDRKVFEEHATSEHEVIKIAADTDGACCRLR